MPKITRKSNGTKTVHGKNGIAGNLPSDQVRTGPAAGIGPKPNLITNQTPFEKPSISSFFERANHAAWSEAGSNPDKIAAMITSTDPASRAAAAAFASSLTPEQHTALANDPDSDVRLAYTTANPPAQQIRRKAPPVMQRGDQLWEKFEGIFLNRESRPTEDKASNIARLAHLGQTDQNGEDYYLHPAAVVELATQQPQYQELTPEQQEQVRITAWLHDTLEDTALNPDDLRKAGYSEEIINAIDAVTSRDGEPKEEYYERVKAGGPVSLCVKLGDLAHNNLPDRRETLPGSPSNPCKDGEEDRFTKLGKKYYKAYTALGAEVPAHLQQFKPTA